MTHAPPSPVQSWFVHDGQAQHGPVTEAEILEQIAAGRLVDAHISAPGSGQWIPLRAHRPFAQALQTKLPPKRKRGNRAIGIGLGVVGLVAVVGVLLFASSAIGSSKRYDLQSATKVVGHKTKSKGDRLLISVKIEVPKGVEILKITGHRGSGTTKHGPQHKTKPNKKRIIAAQFDAPVAWFQPGKTEELTVKISARDPSDEDRRVYARHVVRIDRKRKLEVRDGGTKATCGADCAVSLPATGTSLRVQLPREAALAVDGVAVKRTGGYFIKHEIDVGSRLREGRLTKGGSLALPLKLDVDGKTLKGKLTIPGERVSELVLSHLAANIGKPLTFGTADTKPSRPRALLHAGTVYGTWTEFSDIDLVARKKVVRRDAGSCGTFVNTKTGETRTIGKKANDLHYTVYERRTGKVHAKRVIRAKSPYCPKKLDSTVYTVSSKASAEAGKAYLKSLVK